MSIMNYDSNMTLCGRMAKQTVRLTFGTWDYRKTMEVVVGGNCMGLQVIDSAVGIAYEKLEFRKVFDTEYAIIILERGEDTCEVQDDDDKGERWLQDMLVAAEIIAIEPSP